MILALVTVCACMSSDKMPLEAFISSDVTESQNATRNKIPFHIKK